MTQIRIKDVPRCERKKYKARCVAEHNRRYLLLPLHIEALQMDKVWMEHNRPEVVAAERTGRIRPSLSLYKCRFCRSLEL